MLMARPRKSPDPGEQDKPKKRPAPPTRAASVRRTTPRKKNAVAAPVAPAAAPPTPAPTSVAQLDLRPKPGKTYFNTDRECREEFIYFLMIDRFHDDADRKPIQQSGRSPGIQTPNDFYGGTLKGITRHLDYIAGLGCTAIWISPVFENNPAAYHGYDINNYLDVDPHFGTKQDLIDLVEAAHGYKKDGQPWPMRIILDVVINNSGDNWEYDGGPKQYNNDQRYNFGSWRRPDRPIPTELRNPDWYHRCGRIGPGGYDRYPENQHGDIDGLKDFANDDDTVGDQILDTLIRSYCWWIREADVDGFRVDAVKHMGELACARFCSGVREYAYSVGKRGFFLFGEIASPGDEIYDRYLGPNTSIQDGRNTVFFGLDSVLDFRLAEGAGPGQEGLRDVIKGFVGPQTLFERVAAQRNRALNHGELGRYLVSFVDNHDSFWQKAGRIAAGAPDEQVIAAIGYLLCALGTACIYYGTEQGFEGKGGDNEMREAMFDVARPGVNLLNPDCTIYQKIAAIAAVMRDREPLRFGRIYFRPTSTDGNSCGLPTGTNYTLAFSRVLADREVLIAYNVSAQPRNDCVLVDGTLHRPEDKLTFLFGGQGTVPVEKSPGGTLFVRLALEGRQFVILE
jgi:alpha-amylase